MSRRLNQWRQRVLQRTQTTINLNGSEWREQKMPKEVRLFSLQLAPGNMREVSVSRIESSLLRKKK
jgi:hypothetical protein